LGSLGVADSKVPSHLAEGDRALRRGLRAKSRQLGDQDGALDLLAAECAFEQWHRLLFARFLADNGLLIHPEFRAAVTLADCEELAEELGEPDGWAVAGRFAAEILPGIFRLDDPCVQLRLAPEGRLALERIAGELPAEVFTADDALGWVYQFWQKERKDEVNASERKIGGADLGPVTQLFTENYMVRFLLENSLGAWWAARHPDSAVVKDWEYLRLDDSGVPAAGSFNGWPERVADVTVMDPCCGSGHFLVEAFGMLWRMRAEEEGLKPTASQDAVLRDNLFGLELDPRCVQIAMFAVALAAWKAGDGWRELPVPHIACSGIPVKAPVEEWTALAGGDLRLDSALVRLHILFRDADTLGSLIDPKRVVELSDPTGLQKSFDDVEWDDLAPLLARALTKEANDPASAVLGADAAGIVRAADYLSRRYVLVATNVPYLTAQRQSEGLRLYSMAYSRIGAADLATTMIQRCRELAGGHGTIAIVTLDAVLYLGAYKRLRAEMLRWDTWNAVVPLGPRAFSSITGEVVKAALLVTTHGAEATEAILVADLERCPSIMDKQQALMSGELLGISQATVLRNPDARFMRRSLEFDEHELLSEFVELRQGLTTGDLLRFSRRFWELIAFDARWTKFQEPGEGQPWDGRSSALLWEGGDGQLQALSVARGQMTSWRGQSVWGRSGILLGQMTLIPSLYSGDRYPDTAVVLIPRDDSLLGPIWEFLSSDEYALDVRAIDSSLKVPAATTVKVPFDVDRWRALSEERFPDGLPEQWTDDATQWLFEGRPEAATDPLQVAVGRLVGFRWPMQPESDGLGDLSDDDGIVCLPSVLGERSAADRVQELLARAFGGTWSPARTGELLKASGSRKENLESWLRDDFFKAHCQTFKNRPFVWQIWDGRKDGFSALVDYHRLDRPTLERLTYVYLGDWNERQSAGLRDDVSGAEERLAAAQDLQRRLELILKGEPPFDIFVRWKDLANHPMGWEPDLNDGVRLNVRPFVEAGVLRSKFNVKWEKDRGKNPDGTERRNDLHFTLADKQAASRGTAS